MMIGRGSKEKGKQESTGKKVGRGGGSSKSPKRELHPGVGKKKGGRIRGGGEKESAG